MREYARTGVCWIWVLTVPLWGAEPGSSIRLFDHTTVAGPNISLGDVAVITCEGKGLADSLKKVVLEKAAPTGQKVSITSAAVKIALSRDGYSIDGFRFEGALSTVVLTQTQEVSPDQFLEAAKSFILSQTGENEMNLQVKILGPLKNLIVSSGSLEIRFRPALIGKYEGVQILTAELIVDGREVRVVPVRLDTQVFHSVVQAKRDVKKGEKFTAENIALGRLQTSQLLRGSLQHLDDVLGRTASFDLKKGTPIRFSEINDPPAIRRGTIVQAFMESGNVEIIVHARAVEDGKAGEVIHVENTDFYYNTRANEE